MVDTKLNWEWLHPFLATNRTLVKQMSSFGYEYTYQNHEYKVRTMNTKRGLIHLLYSQLVTMSVKERALWTGSRGFGRTPLLGPKHMNIKLYRLQAVH